VQEKYDQLTKGMKRVADLLLADPTAFAARSAKTVGESIGVSETMIIRFCNALGYQGYSELQQEIREVIYDIRTAKWSNDGKESDQSPYSFKQIMRWDQTNIENTLNHMNPEDMDAAVSKIVDADAVLVAGLHAAFPMAHWFTFALDLLKKNCQLYRPEFSTHLGGFTDQSVLVVFSFYRYSLHPIRLAEKAKEKGLFVIAFTDTTIAPITEYADIVFTLEIPTRSILQFAPVTFSMMNALLSGISVKSNAHIDFKEEDKIMDFFVQ